MNYIIRNKLFFLFFAPALMLTSCTTQSNERTYNKTITMCFDSKSETYNNTIVRYNAIPVCSANKDGSFTFSANIAVLNDGEEPIDYNIYDIKMFNYSKDTSHEASTRSTSFRLGGGFGESLYFTSTIPTSIEKEEYHLSFGLNDTKYVFVLQNMPEELKKDVTVNYIINNQVVHSKTLKEGNKLNEDYIYDAPNHLQYCSKWKDSNNTQYSKEYVVNNDLNLYGTLTNNLNVWYMTGDHVACFNSIYHVPLDGVLVLPNDCDGKQYFISAGTIYNNTNIKEVYVPLAVMEIYRNNFINCPIKTIYFAGSKDQWDAIPKAVTIPSTIRIVYNTTFQA